MPIRRTIRVAVFLLPHSLRPRHGHSSALITEEQSIPQNDAITSPAFPAIYVRGLTKRFSGADVAALNDVDLDVRAGTIHGVLGLSGAGKSTLLRCVARLERPDAGEIRIAGSDWTNLHDAELRRQRSKMGIVYQQLHLLASRTVAANVALPLELHGTPRVAIASRVTELLEWFGIADKAAQFPAQLSGGQRQRVALARALATAPRVLLADEPTSALDAETRASVLNTLKRIRDQLGVTVLVITHDLRSTAGICDSVTILDAGRVVETGPASEVLRRPSNDVTRRLLAHTESQAFKGAMAHHLRFEEMTQP
jgi:D-methionine transport system ATP-binding protein